MRQKTFNLILKTLSLQNALRPLFIILNHSFGSCQEDKKYFFSIFQLLSTKNRYTYVKYLQTVYIIYIYTYCNSWMRFDSVDGTKVGVRSVQCKKYKSMNIGTLIFCINQPYIQYSRECYSHIGSVLVMSLFALTPSTRSWLSSLQ